ncbi:MAG: hypoxanthine phosphoribosyltransferase [Acidobacteria bacterium]|nr:MAG: hypoxanthine phosphoribosyltransferase [Acidobacteriota bacterium]
MKGKIKSVLVDEATIQAKVKEIASELNRDYKGKEIIAVCLLKGSIVFLSDLIRHLDMPVKIEVMRASSYGESTESSGSVKIITDLESEIKDQHVIVVEDIVDTGRTLSKTLKLLRFRKPASLKVCSLLDKPCRREIPIDIDYTGITIEDHFVVGYGLDYAEYYRNLPYIGILEL